VLISARLLQTLAFDHQNFIDRDWAAGVMRPTALDMASEYAQIEAMHATAASALAPNEQSVG